MSWDPDDQKGEFTGNADLEYETEEDALCHFELLAAQEATRLGYGLQYLGYREEALTQELNAGNGERPKKVQMANLMRGLLLSLLGVSILAVHFVVVLWAIEWLELGWKAYLIALGVSLSGAISTAFVLRGVFKIFTKNEHDGHTVFLTYLAAFILGLSIISSFGLGKVRVELVKMKFNEISSPVIIQGEQVEDGSERDPASRFYEKTLPLLGLILPLLAILFDISAGILLHVGFDKLITSTVALGLIRERERIYQKKIEMATRKDTMEGEPKRRFYRWRSRERKKAEKARRLEGKRAYRESPAFRKRRLAMGLVAFIIVTLLILFLTASGWPDTVVEIDMSLSEKKTSVMGEDGFEANKRAIGRIIQSLESGETFYIVGITGKSRTDPLVLLKAKLTENPGYFGERLKRDRAIILASWQKTAERLTPFSKETDIVGALELGAELLQRAKGKTLYLLSDGKNCTMTLNIERPPKKRGVFEKRLRSIKAFPNLEGVDVFWLGAGGPGTTNLHLESLEGFWRSFIERSGGRLSVFTSLREVQE
jgi:hypothetical protein